MKLFTKNMIDYADKTVEDWKQGIEIASQLLINNGYVQKDYIDKIIDTTNKLGPYYVIAPKLALLHTAADENMKENAISFTYFKNPIIFKEQSRYHVNFCLALAAKDNNSHINILQAVAQLFTNQDFLTALETCKSKDELRQTIENYDN